MSLFLFLCTAYQRKHHWCLCVLGVCKVEGMNVDIFLWSDVKHEGELFHLKESSYPSQWTRRQQVWTVCGQVKHSCWFSFLKKTLVCLYTQKTAFYVAFYLWDIPYKNPVCFIRYWLSYLLLVLTIKDRFYSNLAPKGITVCIVERESPKKKTFNANDKHRAMQ